MWIPPWVSRLQIPVGFGGFHVALLGSPFLQQAFILVYDCGSLMQQHACDWAVRVGREISRCDAQVDLAVLSHTDFDHVCGIESLAKSVHIETLMLPRITLSFRAAHVAAVSPSNPLWYRRFVSDPLAWARGRGISRVIFVDGEPGDGEAGPVEQTRNPTHSDRAGQPILGSGRSTRRERGETVVSSGDPQPIQSGTTTDWWIVPIVAPPKSSAGLTDALASELQGKAPNDIYAGLSMRKKASLRNRLARVYRRYWKDTNRSSVMLLVARPGASGGWLCTGDANLREAETQRRLGQHARLFAGVDAVHVPHHGSPHNLDAQAAQWLQSLSPRSFTWVVSSGKNQWRYPHHSVESACQKLCGPREASCDWNDVIPF
jgi:hypothetical protein